MEQIILRPLYVVIGVFVVSAVIGQVLGIDPSIVFKSLLGMGVFAALAGFFKFALSKG